MKTYCNWHRWNFTTHFAVVWSLYNIL